MGSDGVLVEELEKLKHEANTLRTTLNQVNAEKEKWFQDKEKTGSEIRALIGQIQDIKQKRDSFTSQVKAAKAKKEALVSEIKAKIVQLKELKDKKVEFLQKHNIRGDPFRMRRQIEVLESRIETEVIPFDEEKRLMKKIKLMKAQLSEFGELNRIMDQMNELGQSVDSLKVQEKEFKKEVRKHARDSQREHEQIQELFKRIDALREQEKGQYEKFLEFKNIFNETNSRLKELLPRLGETRESVTAVREKKRRDAELKEKLTLDEKRNRVQEKIRKGEKLTTEDLLVFQND